jgi:phosphatidylinositol alpha-mannosyltransferase
MPVTLKRQQTAVAQDSSLDEVVASQHATRRLRICQVVPYALDENGGVKHHALQLAAALAAAGDEVTVIGPSTRSSTKGRVRSFRGVFNITSNGSANRIGLFASLPEVREFFRSTDFDLVQVHEPLVPLLGWWAILSASHCARVATFHSYAERPRRALALFAKLVGTVQTPAFHAATAVSEMASAYAGTFWSQPRSIVPNGVCTETFTPPTSARTPGPVRLLFVGRLGDRRKGLATMLAAYQILRSRNVEVALDIVGELGSSAPPPALPGLSYHGPVSREALAERYRRCDVFVAPSTGQESFGIVLLEAMATARPVVCSDIDGYRSTVTEIGSRLVTPSDAPALAGTIADLVARRDLWAAMGKANLARARAFSWRRIARDMRGVYLKALAVSEARATGRRGQSVAAEWEPAPMFPTVDYLPRVK